MGCHLPGNSLLASLTAGFRCSRFRSRKLSRSPASAGRAPNVRRSPSPVRFLLIPLFLSGLCGPTRILRNEKLVNEMPGAVRHSPRVKGPSVCQERVPTLARARASVSDYPAWCCACGREHVPSYHTGWGAGTHLGFTDGLERFADRRVLGAALSARALRDYGTSGAVRRSRGASTDRAPSGRVVVRAGAAG